MINQKSNMERFIELYESFGIDLNPTKLPNDGYEISLNENISNKFGGMEVLGQK